MVFSRRWSQAIVGAWLAIILAGGTIAAVHFRIDNSVAVWFGTSDPALVSYRQAGDEFGDHEWLMVALDQAGAPSAAADRDRDVLSVAITQLPHTGMVVTAADVPDSSALVRTLLRPRHAGTHQALLVQVANDLDRQDGYREELLDQIRARAAPLPTVRAVHIAGTAAINGELNRSARHDMLRFFPAVVLMLGLVGLLVFRNMRDTTALLATAFGTVLIAAGALAAAGHSLNMVTVMLPTILIALSVADAVHLIHAYHHHDTVRDAIHAVWKPSLGTTLTTMGGFLAFATSDVLPIRQLALFGALGVAVALVLTFTLTPALLTLLWSGTTATPRTQPRATRLGILIAVHRRPRSVVAAFGALALLFGGIPALIADTDYAAFFRSGTTVPEDYAAMRAHGFPVNGVTVVVTLPTVTAARPATDGAAMMAFATAVGSLPGVPAVLSPFTLSGLGGDAAALKRAGLVSADEDKIQLIAMIDGTSSQELFAATRSIDSLARQILPATMSVVPTGTPYLWARMDDGVIETQRQSLLIVSLVCLAVLTWHFGSIGTALFTVTVSLFPVALILGLMGVLRIPLNLATVLIAGIAVGIAVDDTIHYVHVWQRARRAGADAAEAVRTATAQVSGRLVATSVILTGAFLGLGLSDFLPTAQFGLLASLTIVLALATDLFLVPVLLGWNGRFRRFA
jgi:predicted RND superfamily exporter protein